MNRPLSLTRHIHKLRWIDDQIVAGVISNEMPCIQHHEFWHTVQFLQVRTEDVWQKILQELGAVWVSVEPNIRWQCEVLLWLSRSDVCKLFHFTQHVSIVPPVEHHEKLCFVVPSFEAGTILLLKMCCHFIQCNIWDGFCVIGCGIYIQFRNLVLGIKVSLPIVKCPYHFFVNTGFKYTFLYINRYWLRLTACFFFLAIVVTKQCWYCCQKFHSYALPFLHMVSCHNYTKLNMCIWLWFDAKDCPWLSNSTLTVILILLHSVTEHVLGSYWWGCTASALSRLWGSMTQSLYLSIMEINVRARVCVCVRACVCVCRFAQNTWTKN